MWIKATKPWNKKNQTAIGKKIIYFHQTVKLESYIKMSVPQCIAMHLNAVWGGISWTSVVSIITAFSFVPTAPGIETWTVHSLQITWLHVCVRVCKAFDACVWLCQSANAAHWSQPCRTLHGQYHAKYNLHSFSGCGVPFRVDVRKSLPRKSHTHFPLVLCPLD